MTDSERARRNSILGIDLLQEMGRGANHPDPEWEGEPATLTQNGTQVVGADVPFFDNRTPSAHFGALQAVVDELFEDAPDEYSIRRLDAVIAAEAADLPDELLELVNLLPPGSYSRKRLCTQLNSAIAGRAWGQVYGTVV